MKPKKPLWKQPGVQITAVLLVIMVVGGIVAALFLTQLPPDQPIAFPHDRHVGMGATCLYCHPGAALGPSAGVPGIEKCWGCHQQVQKQSPDLTILAGFVERNVLAIAGASSIASITMSGSRCSRRISMLAFTENETFPLYANLLIL